MADDTPSAIVRELREMICKKQGITKQTFAERTGWSFSTLHRLEKGEAEFTGAHLKELVGGGWIKERDAWYQRFEQAIDQAIKRATEKKPTVTPKPAGPGVGFPLVLTLAFFALVVIAAGCFFLAKVITNTQTSTSTSTPPVAEATTTRMTQPRSQDVLFQDNFETALGSGWEIIQGDWRIVDQRLTSISRKGKWSTAYVGDASWVDYAVELDADFRPAQWDPVEVYIRAQDDRNKVTLRLERAGSYPQLAIVKDGESVVLGKAQEYLTDEDRVRLEAKGDLYTAYVNGKKYVSAHDPNFLQGQGGPGSVLRRRYGMQHNQQLQGHVISRVILLRGRRLHMISHAK